MTNETLRMQMLAGIITEGEYKAKLQESLWDRIKDTPKAWIAKIKGGAPAIMASALSDGGFKVGVPVYGYDGGDLLKMTIKSVDYNTGTTDIIYEKSLDGGKNWVTDEKESLKTKLEVDEDLSRLLTKTPEERKVWYDKTVKNIKDSFTKKDSSYKIEDLKPDTPREKPEWTSNKMIDEPSFSLERQRELGLQENKKKKSLKESMIGGIVGIGAINQIPPRAKADYETAFEHFLGGKYDLNEVEEVNENMYYHVLEDGGNGNIGHQGVYDTQEEAQNRADELADMFSNSEFYVEASDSEDEPYSVTSSDYDPDKDFNEGKEVEEPTNY